MIKGILVFVVLWVVVAGGIIIFRGMTKKDKLKMVKLALYSGVTSVLALIILVGIVVLF